MARKNNQKFTLAVLSALSVLGNQSLAMNTSEKASRGAVQPVSRGSDKTTKMSPKDNAVIPAIFATLFGLGLAYEYLGNFVGLPTVGRGIGYLAGKDKKSGDKVKVGILPVITKTKYIKEKEYIFIEKNPYVAAQNNGGYDLNKREFSCTQEARMFNLQSLFYQFILNQEVYVDENKFKICKYSGTPERQVRNDCHLKFWQMIYSVVRISNAGNLENSGLTEGLFGDFVRMFKYESGDSVPVFDIDNSNIKFENKKKNEVINTKISFEQPEVEATPNPEDDILFFVNFQMNHNTRYRVTFRKGCFFVEKQQSSGNTFDEWNNVEGGKSKNIKYLDGTLYDE